MTLIITIVGKSNTGKTKVIESIIPYLKNVGLKVLTFKHVHHAVDSLDTPGKDSWRHRRAGACATIVYSSKETALYLDSEILGSTFREILEKIISIIKTDIVLLEGFFSMIDDLYDSFIILTVNKITDVDQSFLDKHRDRIIGVVISDERENTTNSLPIFKIPGNASSLAFRIAELARTSRIKD